MKKQLKDLLNSLPQKEPRSRLEPYLELIDAMRRRNWPYRAIARVLDEKCQIHVSPSNVHHFVKRRDLGNRDPKESSASPASNGMPRRSADPADVPKPITDAGNRINALKDDSKITARDICFFDFDEAEPLRLVSKKRS